MTDASKLLRDLYRYLDFQRSVGVDAIGPLPKEVLRSLRKGTVTMHDDVKPPTPAKGAASTPTPASPATPPPPRKPVGDVAAKLAALDEGQVQSCTKCKLCEGRTRTVFGVGDPGARLMFVGEGPGADEDRQGEPFVGRAGKLLTKIIIAMGLSREQVYIANMVKCRPPGNRNPEADELAICRPYLDEQIELIRPQFIVALGNVPAQTLLDKKTPMRDMRGRFFPYAEGIQLMPTYHPSYLLRNPGAKRLVWEDIQKLMERMGLPVPEK